ncbi:MAG TPA: ATP-binding protein [Thermoanaerobaculia bacterium]|nr:ATP-binding protein [Thermoanaerobaculia bacterium]
MRKPLSDLSEHSPKLWRTACQEMASRSRGGVVFYPVAIAFLGLGSNLSGAAPAAFAAIMALVVSLAVVRQVLIQRFDIFYDRMPLLWQAGFFGGLVATCCAFGGMFYVLLRQRGLEAFTLFVLAVAAGLAILALSVYSHALAFVRLYILLMMGPPAMALAQASRGGATLEAWFFWAIVVATVYLFWASRQQHRERWASLTDRHQLADLRSSRDELERLVAERTRALERTGQDYRQIFENAHDPIIIFRPEDEKVLNVNRRACEVYGYTREEFMRISMASISENVSRGQQQIQQTLEQGVYHHFESIQLRKDGRRMFLEINASVIEYEGRRAILSINRDVTERRRSESMRLAKEAAERAAQAKTQFLANMSHEIRTPMAGVVGLADLLLATDLDERQTEYAQLIQSSAVSLLRVIDDILDFSRIDSGKLAFEDIAFDLGATLRQVVQLLRLAAVARGTTLDLHLAPELPAWVRGDPGRLRQVLINLVGNAIKFTSGGEVKVWAEITGCEWIHIRVEDTGIGIPYEAQGRLFELFSQADDATARNFGGTGLGLAISKRIVEAMGGEIGFDSAPGKGSTFWITVLLESTSPLAGTGISESRPAPSSRILTAEDNAVNQLVISEQLRTLGYEVTSVSNGLEVLDALETGTYDLVLMDCQMPQLDGYEAAARIRQLPGVTSRIPIVALTAHALQEELDKCLTAGMDDYITKPFREEVLQRKLTRWLGGDPGAPEEAGSEPPQPTPAEDGLDPWQLQSLRLMGREAGSDFVPQLVEQFRGQPYLDELRRALDRGDRMALKSRAHALKGTSSLLGAVRLPRLCAQLESECLEASPEECRRQVALIETEHRKVLHKLTRALEPGASSRRRSGGPASTAPAR